MTPDLPPVEAFNQVFEAMSTSRAVRRFRPDPIPPETIEALVWAATRAASPENSQPWEFVVVTEPAVRERIGSLVSAAADVHAASLPPTDDPGVQRTRKRPGTWSGTSGRRP